MDINALLEDIRDKEHMRQRQEREDANHCWDLLYAGQRMKEWRRRFKSNKYTNVSIQARMEWPIDVPEKWARCYVQFWKAHKLEESIRITQEAFDVLTRGVKQEPKNRSDWHIFIIERNTPEPRPQRKATMIKQQAPKKALLLEILADDELPAPALLEAPREPAIIESNQYTLLDILTDCDEAPDFNF